MIEQKSFFNIFEELENSRDNRGKIYPLIDIIIFTLYGVLAGFCDFINMSYYLKKREQERMTELGLSKDITSHDVFRVIDVEKFMALFVDWTKSIAIAKAGKQIAIDGTVRAAMKKANNGTISYVLSAFLYRYGISIRQKEVEEKTNEIPEIPKLLDLINITDCTITIDAIGTQTEIINKIIKKEGHFCLQLKKNQRTAFEDVGLFFKDMEEDGVKEFKKLSTYTELTKDHRRIEKREYYTFSKQKEVKQILNPKWGFVNCLGMEHLTRTVGERTSVEVHYHLLAQESSAENYGKLARGHWEMKNSLHWVLDVPFAEMLPLQIVNMR